MSYGQSYSAILIGTYTSPTHDINRMTMSNIFIETEHRAASVTAELLVELLVTSLRLSVP